MVHLQQKELRKYLRNFDSDFLLVLYECLHNVFVVHVRVKLRDSESYRHILAGFLKQKPPVEKRLALLLTKTGFEPIERIIKLFFIHLD